jgi:hypothetical protein
MFFSVAVNYVYYVHVKKNKVIHNLIKIYKDMHTRKNEKFVSDYAQSKHVSE